MQLQSYYLQRHDNGAFLQNGKAYVYLTGGTTAAQLYDQSGTPISNPARADANGKVSFAAIDGVYDLVFASSDDAYTSPTFAKVQIFDLQKQVITDATTARTLSVTDLSAYIRFTSSSAVTCTVPLNSAQPFPIGAEISGCQAGAGSLTIAAAAGVTINSRGADLTVAGQFAIFTLKKVATDTWDLAGDM